MKLSFLSPCVLIIETYKMEGLCIAMERFVI